MSKNTINLLQPELYPKEAFLTLKRVVISWAVVFVVMLASVLFSSNQINERTEEQLSLQKTKSQQTKLLTDLENKIRKNKPAQALVVKLSTLKLLMENKQALHSELTDNNTTYVAGFAKAMTDLSQVHNRNVSLSQVTIAHNDMTFIGMARTPDAVPQWLAQFESSPLFSGKVFSHFSLIENENNYIDFVVSTKRVEVAK